ncbi:lasso RiPP family leader peptide-containing protein [Streptomyces sp. NPDC049585]
MEPQEIYESPALAEAGDFSELTLGWPSGAYPEPYGGYEYWG